VKVGTLRWNVSDRKKFFSVAAQQDACPLIFDESGNPVDYAIEFAKVVRQTTEEYQDAFSDYQTTKSDEDKKKLDCAIANYQKAVGAFNAHPQASVNKRFVVSTASGDSGCYLMGPTDCETGLATELAMVRAIGDRQAVLHGVKCEFSIGQRSLSSFSDGFFFIASDGVWDVFRKEKLASLVVSKGGNVFDDVVAEAKKLFGSKHDDISFAVAHFTQ